VIRRFLRAMRAAETIMHADPARAAADVHALVPESDLATVRRQVDAARALTFNAITSHDGLGVFTPARVRLTWSWVVREHDLPPGKIDPLAVVANQHFGP
jgi:NitT/TauT family transport system substrate-binding protein